MYLHQRLFHEPGQQAEHLAAAVVGDHLGRGERRYGDAAETFARLVEIDPFLEAAHRGLMQCHAALGNRTRAVRQYQALVDLLAAEAGTTPAPETTALYMKLRHSPA